MRKVILMRRPAICLAAFVSTLVTGVLAAAPLPRSISSSRQFIIYGADVPLRGAIADVAERTKASLLGVLQRRDDWKTPIVVNLQFPQANVPETPRSAVHFSQTGFGLKLQLDLTIEADVNAPSIQRELLRALFLELIYRNHSDIAPGTVYAQAPDWLIEGVLAMGAGSEKEALAQALTATITSGKVMLLEQFLQQKPEQLDSPARLLYRAYSFALLQLLINQAEGPARLAAYVDNLSRASNDPLADLRLRFPMLGDAADLGAMWKSSVATFAITGSFQLLSFPETERQLAELLHIRMRDSSGAEKVSQLEKLVGTKLLPAQKAALNHTGQNLLLLSTLANPLLQPIVVEYQKIAQLIAAGKRKGLAQRLTRLKATRARLAGRMSDIDDYLNWFEATQLNTKSGAFTDYLKAAGESNEPEPRRRDALSVYLDAVEAKFEN
jgi:hypothetical protein